MGRIADTRRAFSEIYRRDAWFGGSGHGSRPEHTRPYISVLQTFLQTNQIRTVVDFGCGDWQVSKLINWEGVRYTGFDIVDSLVRKNQQSYGSDTISFCVIDASTSLPPSDLLICKDVLQHLPNKEVQHYLSIFKRLYRFILVTNDVIPDEYTNRDIEHGAVRAVRLDLPPFNEPHEVLLEWNVDDPYYPTIKHTCLVAGCGAADPNSAELRLEIPYTTRELVRRNLKMVVHSLRNASPVLRGPIDKLLSVGRRLRRTRSQR